MSIFWAEYLSVGNAMIDADHKNMILMANSMEDAIGKCDSAALLNEVESFVAYMIIHINNEKQIADAINFPLVQDASENQQLMYEVRCVLENLDTRNGIWPENLISKYLHFLNGWVIDHIIAKDMQMKHVLRKYPYDFRPG